VLNERNAKAFLPFWHANSVYPEIKRNHEALYSRYRAEISALMQAARRRALILSVRGDQSRTAPPNRGRRAFRGKP
jgi:hypothetical protein